MSKVGYRSRLSHVLAFARRLARDNRGVSITELALALPILLTLGLYGTELAYMSMVKMRVAQIATAVADNASRLGQTDNSSVTPTVKESDIDSVMSGALTQGNTFNFSANGRIILSSLEINPTTKGQWIHWQRCRGSLKRNSAYGSTMTAVAGMGKTGHLITAVANSAVMYVEVYYEYQPLFGTMFAKSGTQFYQEAAYQIRDDRNLNPSSPPDGVTGGNGKSLCT